MIINKPLPLGRNGGYYAFADDYVCWVHGLSAEEKRDLVRQHGAVKFYSKDPTEFGKWQRVTYPNMRII